MTQEIELLAPAGSMESLKAAIENGANAVYLGGKLLNARKYASNFEENEILEAIPYAHLHGVKIFVTLNILVSDYEMEEAIDYVSFLYESDVDAIIVQDIGFANIISKIFPDLHIHASTQMTINNLYGARYLEKMGFTRVVLARETPIEEIKKIRDNTKIELEGFVHGALCMAYSGQCLMSSFIGGRSGNRGSCAQPCRMPYNIVDENGNLLEKLDKLHYLSPKDLNTLDDLDKLIDAGISSLKIEGRMKRKEYVASVVKSYRKALDKGRWAVSNEEREDLAQIFNRDFTIGLGLGDFGRDFMSVDRPDNRGILAGHIVDADRKNIYVKLESDIDKGDGLEFQLSNGKYVGLQSPRDARRGSTISLFKRGSVDIGSKLYRTSSVKLLDRLNQNRQQDKGAIDMSLVIKQGSYPKLELSYGDYKVQLELDKIVEESKNIPLTKEKIKEQMDRLGNTSYYLRDIEIDLDNNSFMTHGDLNSLRRNALAKLEDKISNFYNRSPLDDKDYNILKTRSLEVKSFDKMEGPKLSIKVESLEQVKKLNLNKLDRIYLPVKGDLPLMIDEVQGYNLQVFLWTEKILYSHDLEKYKRIIDPVIDRLDGISVSNLGTYEFIRTNYQKTINGDIGLNIFNCHTANYFLEKMDSVSLSPELNLQQIRQINDKVHGNMEALVYGYIPAMITRNCPFATIKNCKNDDKCSTCKYAKGYGLHDRMGMNFKSYRKANYSVIYNSVPLFLLDKLGEIKDSGVNIFRLDFTDELEDIDIISSIYYDYLNGNIDQDQARDFVESYRENKDITMGHFYRGII